MNVLLIAGNVGQDPELRHTAEGLAVVKFSVATENYKKGEKPPPTWHNCTAFGKTAEYVGQYIQKGSKVTVRGRIGNQSWEGKDGQKKYKTVVLVDEVKNQSERRDKPVDSRSMGDTPSTFPDDDVPF